MTDFISAGGSQYGRLCDSCGAATHSALEVGYQPTGRPMDWKAFDLCAKCAEDFRAVWERPGGPASAGEEHSKGKRWIGAVALAQARLLKKAQKAEDTLARAEMSAAKAKRDKAATKLMLRAIKVAQE